MESNQRQNKRNPHSKQFLEAKKFVPTVPEPFAMTIREDNRRKEILNSKIPEQDMMDVIKDKKEFDHFKAIEMPKHVLEKRYEKIMKKQEKRRLRAKEEAMEDLKSLFKPFSFVEREELKNEMRRSDSVPNLHSNIKDAFEAKPFPEHLFTDFAYEQQKERQNYREIQKKLRQELLLKSSNYPPRMSADFIRKKITENKGNSSNPKKLFPKKVKREKANLDRLYREYRENLERRKLDQDMSVAIEKATLHDRSSKLRKRPRSADSVKKVSQEDNRQGLILRRIIF